MRIPSPILNLNRAGSLLLSYNEVYEGEPMMSFVAVARCEYGSQHKCSALVSSVSSLRSLRLRIRDVQLGIAVQDQGDNEKKNCQALRGSADGNSEGG